MPDFLLHFQKIMAERGLTYKVGFTGRLRSIGEVRIYSRALSATEIQELAGNSPPPPSPQPCPSTGAVHAYPDVIWPPNNKQVDVTISGNLGNTSSAAYLMVNGQQIFLKNGQLNVLNSDGTFNVNVKILAIKKAEYTVELYAADSSSDSGGNATFALVDSTHIIVTNNKAGYKSILNKIEQK